MKKKRLLGISIITALAIGLAGCSGRSVPSVDEIKSAIADGTLTVEDALDKGWIDEKWIEENTDRVEAADKSKSNLLGDFDTKTVGGEPFMADDMASLSFVYFFSPQSSDALHKLDEISDVYTGIKENGGEVLGVALGERPADYAEQLGKYDFPIICYNDSMRGAMGSLDEMMVPDGFIGVWNRDRAFLSAWMLKIDAKGLPEYAAAMANYGKPQPKTEGDYEAAAMPAPEIGR